MAKIIKDVKVTWAKGAGTDDSSLLGFNVAVTVQGKSPTESDIAFKYVAPTQLSTIFNNLVLDSALIYVPWVQTVYLGKDSAWASAGTLSEADDGSATISNNNITGTQLVNNGVWGELPASGADVTSAAMEAKVEIVEGGLKITDESTDDNDYVEIGPASIVFTYNGATYAAVNRIDTDDAISGETVVFSPPFKTTPKVIAVLKNMRTWDESANSNYDQNIVVEVNEVDEEGFKVVANQVLQGGADYNDTDDHGLPHSEEKSNIDMVSCRIKVEAYQYCTNDSDPETSGCSDGTEVGMTVSVKLRNHTGYKSTDNGYASATYDDYYEVWSHQVGTSDYYINITMPYANRWDIYVSASANGIDCSAPGCAGSSIAMWRRLDWHTEGQETLAEGDIEWIAIEGGS